MSWYRKVDIRVWNDMKFRRLSDDGKLVFLYLLTHQSMTQLGAMPGTAPGLAPTLKWSTERFHKGLAELSANSMVEYDDEAGIVCLPNFLRYNAPENPNVVKAWGSSYDMLPECDLKIKTLSRAYEALRGRPKSFVEAFAKLFGEQSANGSANHWRNGTPNKEQEPEPEQEPKESASEEGLASTRTREAKPSVDDEDISFVREDDGYVDQEGYEAHCSKREQTNNYAAQSRGK
ncbi:hypothetical protein X739_21205 [Mesorhizobium sp. LNHC220B00]|uniref:hypothetical protein n=1 Tax=Mesorhizobium sp. LNHC229A00 TaxID=1287240 RepID=UPI0003CF241D|nr:MULTISPECIES: hypothetical protein [unclassified Mesorhizobium]ESY79599.1 hypothetical protein X741_34340 [Mesorhizobium sp. LNHC229A00]ESY84699.1 hypothetical protein X739_21205 [Mesorhizobium sp. LNHC220B00]